MKKLILLFAFAVAASLLACLCTPQGARAEAPQPEARDRARDLAGWDFIHKQSVNLADHHGHWVVLHFFASWCPPCRAELPTMVPELKRLRKSGIDVISVSLDVQSTEPNLRKLVRQYRMDYPVLYERDEKWSSRSVDWGVAAIPDCYLINPQGVIVLHCRSTEELEAYLKPGSGDAGK